MLLYFSAVISIFSLGEKPNIFIILCLLREKLILFIWTFLQVFLFSSTHVFSLLLHVLQLFRDMWLPSNPVTSYFQRLPFFSCSDVTKIWVYELFKQLFWTLRYTSALICSSGTAVRGAEHTFKAGSISLFTCWTLWMLVLLFMVFNALNTCYSVHGAEHTFRAGSISLFIVSNTLKAYFVAFLWCRAHN